MHRVNIECIEPVRPTASSQPSALSHPSASPANVECIEPVIAECTKIDDASFTEQRNDKRSKLAVLDFSGYEGAYMLPYEFRAKEIDEHQEQGNKAESNITCTESTTEEVLSIIGTNEKNKDSNNKCNSVIEKAESNSTCAESIQEKEDDKVLESCPKVEQAIVHITQSSCSPNIFEEVCLASDLPIFRFGRNFIVDTSIRKILISNFERPMKKGNLLVSNKIVIEHIGQPIAPFVRTDNDLLPQSKHFPLSCLKFIYTWVALLISYWACTWSQLRHVCSNYFRFRNLKPRLESFERTDGSIISYSKTSEIECETQCIAEWGDAKSEPFVCLTP